MKGRAEGRSVQTRGFLESIKITGAPRYHPQVAQMKPEKTSEKLGGRTQNLRTRKVRAELEDPKTPSIFHDFIRWTR